jgi:hypothetical protein
MRLARFRLPRRLMTASGVTLLIGLAAGPAAAAPPVPTWPANPQPISAPAAAPTPPTWAAHPQTLTPPPATSDSSSSRFDWGSAGIGAGTAVALVGVTLGAVAVVVRRRRRPRSPSLAG